MLQPGIFSCSQVLPCIDSGTLSNAPQKDYLGVIRPFFSGIDMGAYEFTDSLIAWWPMDELSGNQVKDVIFNNDGEHIDQPFAAVGVSGNCLDFDGSNDYVQVEDNDLWAFGDDDFTISLWANFSAPSSGSVSNPGDVFIGNDENAGIHEKWFFALGGGVLNFHINGNGIGPQFFPLVPFEPTLGEWYHLAVKREGNLYTIYVNGTAEGSEENTSTISNPSAPLTIGYAEENSYMNGKLDEIMIYKRALADSELADIYNKFSSVMPEISITSPQTDISIENSQTEYNFSGTASDADGTVSKVEYSVNSGSWMVAVGTESWNFTANDLAVGDNIVMVRAQDNDGVYSVSMQRVINRAAANQAVFFGDFAVTALSYSYNSNWSETVNDLFSGNYRVADWNDLKEYYNAGGDLISLFDGLGDYTV